jgi:dihydrofolate reductase
MSVTFGAHDRRVNKGLGRSGADRFRAVEARMGNVIASLFVTLDGVMEGPGPHDPFPRAGWSLPFWNDQIAKLKRDELFAADAILLGRHTYRGFAATWPNATDDQGFADRMNSIPKWVVSKQLERVEWSGSQLIRGDLATEVHRLKQLLRNDILIAGSRQVIYSLMPHDIIDEYRLLVYPVVLGAGNKLFENVRLQLQLGESRQLGEVTLMRLFRRT